MLIRPVECLRILSYILGSLIRAAEAFSPSNPLELIVFDAENLSSLASVDGAEDRSIGLATVLEQGTPEVWHLSFGQLTASTVRTTIGCAGDFDSDGHEDVMVVLTHFDGRRLRGQIILFAYSDLATIDTLDGEADYRVNVELLWPSG